MKINKIGNYTTTNTNFTSRLPVFRYSAVDSFISMEDKFISAEVDFVKALSKKNSKLHAALKNMNIPKYDVPLLKTLLINPAFDDEKVYEKIPQMISTKWAWEDKNRACAAGRKNIADLYATNPILNQNEAFQNKIGEILLNSTTKESSDYTVNLINKYLSNQLLYENKSLSERLPEIIIKMQDSLYDSRIDKKGVNESILRCMDFCTVSAYDKGINPLSGDSVQNGYVFKTL